MEKMLITGVAGDKNTARISVMGVEDKPGIAFRIFNTLAKNNINVDIILQSVGREGTKDISFTVAQDELKRALEILEEVFEEGAYSNIAAKMFESLYNSRINISMISTSEIRITVLIDEKDIDEAMNAVHDGFALALVE